jgi:excisionase family DNA binding protein
MAEAGRGDAPTERLEMREAAALVGRHPETIRRWVWSGRLDARRRGRRLLVARADLEALAAVDGSRVDGLSAWAERARAVRGAARGGASAESAADLVIEDRTERSSLAEAHAGR